MTILEIRREPRTDNSCAVVHLDIDGSEYLIIGNHITSCWGVTIITGRWIRDRRSLGKTFFNSESVRKHYKKHGKIIAEYAEQLTGPTV